MDRSQFDVTLEQLLARRRRSRLVEVLLFAALVAAGYALLVGLAACSAQERDVPSSARREIAMRGERIERVDLSARAFATENLIGQAAETPPDDSHKWHLTLLTIGNCAACERLKADVAAHPAFADWVNVADHARSWAHFHVLRYDGDVGREWGRRLEKFLGRKIAEFPTLIVQPPVNGSFGKHTEVVFLHSGYDGDAERLTIKIANAIGKYCAKLQQVRMIARRGGHGDQVDEDQVAGDEFEREASPPPFLLAPTNPPPTAGLQFPSTIIPPRIAATVDQIRQVLPSAPPEFLLAQISRGATLEEVLSAWQLEQLKQPAPAPAPQPSGFSLTTLIATVLATMLGTGGLGGMIALGLSLWRRIRVASGKSTLLNDAQFAKLLDEIRKVLGPKAPTNPPAQS